MDTKERMLKKSKHKRATLQKSESTKEQMLQKSKWYKTAIIWKKLSFNRHGVNLGKVRSGYKVRVS